MKSSHNKNRCKDVFGVVHAVRRTNPPVGFVWLLCELLGAHISSSRLKNTPVTCLRCLGANQQFAVD